MTSGVGQISYTTRRDAKTKLLKMGAPGMLPRHKLKDFTSCLAVAGGRHND